MGAQILLAWSLVLLLFAAPSKQNYTPVPGGGGGQSPRSLVIARTVTSAARADIWIHGPEPFRIISVTVAYDSLQSGVFVGGAGSGFTVQRLELPRDPIWPMFTDPTVTNKRTQFYLSGGTVYAPDSVGTRVLSIQLDTDERALFGIAIRCWPVDCGYTSYVWVLRP